MEDFTEIYQEGLALVTGKEANLFVCNILLTPDVNSELYVPLTISFDITKDTPMSVAQEVFEWLGGKFNDTFSSLEVIADQIRSSRDEIFNQCKQLSMETKCETESCKPSTTLPISTASTGATSGFPQLVITGNINSIDGNVQPSHSTTDAFFVPSPFAHTPGTLDHTFNYPL